MPLRIWFTAEDLARTRVADPDPYAETVFSLVPLRFGRHLAGWRDRVRQDLTGPLRPLLWVLPAPRVMLDLVSITGPVTSMEEGLERLEGAPKDLLAHEIEYFARTAGGVPPSLRPLLGIDPRTRAEFARRLRGYHDIAVAPYWAALDRLLDAERVAAGQAILDGGLDAMFERIAPATLRWRAPVLELLHPVQPELETGPDHHLDGRGLLLVPSVFFWPGPVLLRETRRERADVLVYPAPVTDAHAGLWATPQDRGLAALLGSTRAKVLAAAASGASSTEVARRAGTSLASASEHAAVLRAAGLLRTERVGRSVRHSLTGLGARLLNP
jgi:DNA-binding transcriptional ArsR family regulator